MLQCSAFRRGWRHLFSLISALKRLTVKINALKEAGISIHVLTRNLNDRMESVGEEKHKAFESVPLLFCILMPL